MIIQGFELLMHELSVYHVFYFLIGAIFCFINLYFIQKLFYEVLVERQKNALKIAFFGLVKFPILYGLTILLFSSSSMFTSADKLKEPDEGNLKIQVIISQKEISYALLAGFTFALVLGISKKICVFHAVEEGF